jgi:hypothetical protein
LVRAQVKGNAEIGRIRRGGRQKITSTSYYNTIEDLGMLQSGMEAGAIETFDRLDELLAKMHKRRR